MDLEHAQAEYREQLAELHWLSNYRADFVRQKIRTNADVIEMFNVLIRDQRQLVATARAAVAAARGH